MPPVARQLNKNQGHVDLQSAGAYELEYTWMATLLLQSSLCVLRVTTSTSNHN